MNYDIFSEGSATITRCANYEEILVVHDAREFSFSGIRGISTIEKCLPWSLKPLGSSENIPLGVLRMKTWVRDKANPVVKHYARPKFFLAARRVNYQLEWIDGDVGLFCWKSKQSPLICERTVDVSKRIQLP